MQRFCSGTLVNLDEPKPGVRGGVPRPVPPLVSRDADAMERRDATGRVSERISLAEVGRRPGEVCRAALFGASGEVEDAVEVRVGRDVQVGWGVCGLVEDVEFTEVE